MVTPNLTNSRDSTTSTNSTNSTNSTDSTPTTNTPATSTSTSDDSESVDSEVKELIKGRESLTFGPDSLTNNNSNNNNIGKERQPGKDSSIDLNVSNRSSMSHGHGYGHVHSPYHYGNNYIRLTDQQGNTFILYPNGYVTPVRQITGHIGGTGYTNMLTQQLYAQNSTQSFAVLPQPLPPPPPPQLPPQQDANGANVNTNGGYISSSSAMMMMTSTNTAGSVVGPTMGIPSPGHHSLTASPSTSSASPSPYRKNFRKFRHLGRNSSRRNGRQSNLHEVQNSILTLAQFCGDLDLGTTNRFGNLDSTSIIINSSSANTSSRSSYRSVLHLKTN
ncbi:hypothetical protein CANMA_003863 [Candida margitis]|uniref:uncharacterized protein n=1 Tax=Candida margitis TaxID=1775924 RepID=UPI0022276CE1|nr:uncharacterized protein CANMA_003863 [Candida margitis]KAI5961089.1 hypothetical protein CANMA_003863 [Candida margitis]